jgi:hypothetical protein
MIELTDLQMNKERKTEKTGTQRKTIAETAKGERDRKTEREKK